MKVTCATCKTELSEEFPVCDTHPTAAVLVDGKSVESTCLVCSKKFTKQNALDKSERRCRKCHADKDCKGNRFHLGMAEKRKIKEKFKVMFPKAVPVQTNFIEKQQVDELDEAAFRAGQKEEYWRSHTKEEFALFLDKDLDENTDPMPEGYEDDEEPL